MVEKVFLITGMHCESCVELVTEEVEAVQGVSAVSVDLAAGRATVAYDPERASAAAIVHAIREAGYSSSPQ